MPNPSPLSELGTGSSFKGAPGGVQSVFSLKYIYLDLLVIYHTTYTLI